MMKETASIRPDLRWLALSTSALILSCAALLISTTARSQSLDSDTLEELVAPIALYPDDVLAIVLPASTFPLDIVRAARFLEDFENDPTLLPDEAWDESIVALLNYPEIVYMMNDDLDWTWALGEAVLDSESSVLIAAQDFRRRALLAGNLATDERQVVTESDGVISIEPADPEVVYIPVYEPREVVVYHRTPVYSYYPTAYPVYYYPYTSYYFRSDMPFWGVTSYFDIGWHSHYLHIYHHTDRYHPYYLSSLYLYTPYYYRDRLIYTTTINNYTNIWRASARAGDRQITATSEGRNSAARTATRTATVETQGTGFAGRADAIARSTNRDTQSTGSDSSLRRQAAAVGGQLDRTAVVESGTAVSASSSMRAGAQNAQRSVASTTDAGSQLRMVRAPRSVNSAPSPISRGRPSSTGSSVSSSSGSVAGGTLATRSSASPSTSATVRTAPVTTNRVTARPAGRGGSGGIGRNSAVSSRGTAVRSAPISRSSSSISSAGAVRSSGGGARSAPAAVSSSRGGGAVSTGSAGSSAGAASSPPGGRGGSRSR
jgi:hypothetical protein